MLVARLPSARPLSRRTAAQLERAARSLTRSYGGSSRPVVLSINLHLNTTPSCRHFSSTSRTQLREIFPEPEHHYQISKTEAAWPHPPYTVEQMRAIPAHAHREPVDFSDRVALTIVRFLRTCTDFATGYKHDVEEPKKASDAHSITTTKPYQMSERKWLVRFVFLESIAGVPGMVAGMLRHLHSLRRLKRDNGWIETLLEEAFNERMHLLTFLKMAEPGWFMRVMILGAQGVVFNSLFLSYLISPRTVHRFVGYLEEEAVLTYTLAIQDLEAGKLPQWKDPRFRVPDLAVDYWKMPEDKRTMRDLLLYIRADEAKHREVNHTLGNLNQDIDPNPFVSAYKDPSKPHPGKGIEFMKPVGWERNEVI